MTLTSHRSRAVRLGRPPRPSVSPAMRLRRLGAWARPRWPVLLIMSLALVEIGLLWWHFHDLGLTLRYTDGRSKLNMARRLFDSQTPGAGQLGGVWLPFPQLLMALTAWWWPMYATGLAGSLWAMLAFAMSCGMLFCIGRRLSGPVTGVLVVALFAASPPVLYVYASPMTEPLFITSLIAVVLALLRLEDDPRRSGRLYELAGACFVCTMVRYDGWFVLGGVVLFVAFFLRRMGAAWDEIQARLLAFLVLAAQGIVFWLLWETIIFHHPLYFATSKYSAHAIDVLVSGYTQNVNSLPASLGTYLAALRLNFPDWQLGLMVAGLALQLIRAARAGWRQGLAPLVLLTIPLFFVLSLYRGQSAIWIATDPADAHYNIRYGLVAAPLVVVFAALAAGWPLQQLLRGHSAVIGYAAPVLLAGCLLLPSWNGLRTGQLEILRDRAAKVELDREQTARWLRDHYDGGRVLVEVFKQNDLIFTAQIPQRDYITETNLTQFGAALAHPQDWVRWVYVGGRRDDAVRGQVSSNPAFLQYFEQVYSQPAQNPDDRAQIYRLRDTPLR